MLLALTFIITTVNSAYDLTGSLKKLNISKHTPFTDQVHIGLFFFFMLFLKNHNEDD